GSDYASISDFINECRLEYAVNLLNDQPTLPVSQVAQASGFSDANYFGRKFKARFGLSPTQYRSGNQPEPSGHS
ncbi:MAG: AraC family transcriptional regulator, partial [Prevotella sp.]|nr:AraC family transcriptional regulator [Prevotella sp.]